MTVTKADKIAAATFAGAVLAVAVAAGATAGRATVPQAPVTAAYATSNSSGADSDPYGDGNPTSTPTPTPTPVVPDVYGDQGMAAQLAKQHGYGSMSAACKDGGIAWACDVGRVEMGGLGHDWNVYIGQVPLDGDAIAREFLDQAPTSILTVNLLHIPHGKTVFMADTIATAHRKA